MDDLYKDITNVSGIESILSLFGFSDKNSNNIRKFCSKSINITSLALLIFRYLKVN